MLTVLILSSCSPKTIYQVVNTKSENINNDFTFENSDVKFDYNFWNNSSGPPSKFTFYNKSNKPLYLDWSKSSFILNGNSFDYYTESTVTESKVFSQTLASLTKKDKVSALSTQTNISQSSKQKQIQFIPPNSSLTFNLNSFGIKMYNDCGFELKASDTLKEFNYEKSNSPYVFRNYISYSTDENKGEIQTIDHEFWVDKILLMPEKTFLGKKIAIYPCDEKKLNPIYSDSYPYKQNNRFYFTKTERAKSSAGAILGLLGGVLLVLTIIAII